MIAKALLPLAACVAAGFAPAAVQGGQATLGGAAGLRAGPDMLYEVVATAPAGTRVQTMDGAVTYARGGSVIATIEHVSGWTLVRLPSGAKGWVQNALLGAPVALPVEPAVAVVPTPAPQPVPVPRPTTDPLVTAVAPVSAPPAPTGPSAARYTSVVWPSEGKLDLRSGPGDDFAVLRGMERGDWVAVIEKDGPWVMVEHESGVTGWTLSAELTR
ncbi:SH3 domain-containing protein [Psychromarinibacter sp. S121]|uniref:SH3 domain-containing protein n=1 Tax=Psychromarinibacter sp. S121 TaxID=3415127 RepID=UPI003C7A056B